MSDHAGSSPPGDLRECRAGRRPSVARTILVASLCSFVLPACSLPVDDVRYACTNDEACGEGWVCLRDAGALEGICSPLGATGVDVSTSGDGQVAPPDTGGTDVAPVAGDDGGPEAGDSAGDVTACSPGGCDDGDPCTDDSCGLDAICAHLPAVGPACDDGDACTVGDTCGLLGCEPGKVSDCDDGDPCTGDSCLPDKGCQFTPILGCR